jgi:hypothetical protein
MKFNKINILCVIAIFFSIFTSCIKSNRFVVEGHIESAGAGKIYLTEYNLTNEKVIDSCELSKDGSFKFKGKTEGPNFYRLLLNTNNFALLLVTPGERIKINSKTGNLSGNYQVEGSAFSAEVKILNDNLLKNKSALDSLYKLALLYKDRKGYDTLMNRLDAEYADIIKQQRNFSIKFMIENLKSPACIVALYQQFDANTYVFGQNRDLQYIKIVSDTLQKYYPESRAVKALWVDRNRLFKSYNSAKLNYSIKDLPVHIYPEIRLPDKDGDTISLIDVKEKLVLLYFWSPLNQDSYTALSTFKELYSKYHGKGFEIYNVALFDDAGYWSNFVSRMGCAGINVIDQLAGNSVYAKEYNVQKIPATFLLDIKLGVVARDVFGDNLEQQIKKHLK